MIGSVKVLSRTQLLYSILTESNFYEEGVNWNLISIYTMEDEEVICENVLSILDKMHCKRTLSLRFSDVNEKVFFKYNDKYTNQILFNKEHAVKIITFINELEDVEGEEHLIVHCDAGISRSGAVATFLSDYLSLNKEIFNQMNIGIMPNIYILNMLREMTNLKINEENSMFIN